MMEYSIISQETIKHCISEIYDHAFAAGAKTICIRREGFPDLIVSPRYIPQRKREAEKAERRLKASSGDVLLALHSGNRASKRSRDDRSIGFNTNEFYSLKNQALAHLVESGVLAPAAIHKFKRVYAELVAGGGYSFHRPCPPPATDEGVKCVGDKIESKPLEAHEYSAEYAMDVVKYFLEDKLDVPVYVWPTASYDDYDY